MNHPETYSILSILHERYVIMFLYLAKNGLHQVFNVILR